MGTVFHTTGAGSSSRATDDGTLASITDPLDNTTSFEYDDNGNHTAAGDDVFDWDAENRLASATVDSVTTTFAYNGDGLRAASER